MSLRLPHAALALLAGAVACRDAMEPNGPTGPFAVAATDSALRLTNLGDRAVNTFVVDANALPYINWAPCADPVRCPGIAPGGGQIVPFSDASLGLRRGGRAAVSWWHIVRTSDGYRPDSIRVFVIDL